MEIKLRIQLSKNYQVYELETTVEHEKLKLTSDKLIEFANVELNKVVDVVAGKNASTPIANEKTTWKPSDKQVAFIVKMGGSKTKEFNNQKEFNDYIETLKSQVK